MLSLPGESNVKTLQSKIVSVMTVNSLSVEQVLARFFSESMLSSHAIALGKSGKGNAATLAARVLAVWNVGKKENKQVAKDVIVASSKNTEVSMPTEAESTTPITMGPSSPPA